jgi:hypothetical protein
VGACAAPGYVGAVGVVGVVTPKGAVGLYGEPVMGGVVVDPKPAVVPNVAGEFHVGGMDAAPGLLA